MNHFHDIITSAELESILETTPVDENLFIKTKLLLQAIKDWPAAIKEPKELLSILSKDVGEPLTLERISHYGTTLKIEDSAWKIEAISSILDLFHSNSQKTLNELINDIANQRKSA